MVTRYIRSYLTPAGLIAASAIIFAGWTLTSQAALLNLATAPLYMGTNAQPNIMLIIDDSGSMDWETITQDATNDGRVTGTQPDGTSPAGTGTLKHRDQNDNGTADCTFSDQTFYGYTYGVDSPYSSYTNTTQHCNTADDQEWRFRNYQFNTLYFNPNRTYTPWAGVDSGGTPFANMPITAARLDPYNPSSVTIDLTRNNSSRNGSSYGTSDRDGDGQPDGFRYYTWNDNDGDGLFDNGEETQFLIKNADAATKQNFANWFSYYRSRELVAKAAYGRVIAEIRNVRMGLSTLNNNNSVKRAIAVMNDDPATGNKRVLMDALYSINSTNGTPLQTALDECGKYLSCTSNTLFSSCPALSAALGGNCQQNYAIMMTDGFYNGSVPSVGNTDGNPNTAFDGGAYADSYSNTLGDIAMKYYENDIQTGLANNVAIVPGFDEARHQHMATYTVSFGQRGTLVSDPPDRTTAFAWPNPTAGNAEKIDDLRHAAFNGRGLYMSANDPDALVTALQEAIADIMAHTSAASALAFNTTNLSAGAMVYQARFESLSWTGQLRYMPISATGVIGAQTLDAADVLDNAVPNNRVIITRKADTGAGIPFRWASLATTQQTSLNLNSSGSNDSKGSLRVDYLRGDRTKEVSNTGGTFRDRTGVLGDIVDSGPVYVGAPAFFYSFDSYGTFRTANANRTPMIYVGANDGMLHGFDAVTGVERLAYVPGAVYGRLGRLTDTTYSHRYYVDGTPTVGDVYVGGSWRTMLVGSLRGGGQGIFALDVTDPSAMTESNAAQIVKWEFSDANDLDMGYSYSQPVIVRLADGRWAAVFGNGYNNTESDGRVSTTGAAVLYVVDMADGSLIRKITTGVGTAQDPTATSRPNGLATTAPADVNVDSMVDFVYAGDLFGNLWRFDVSSTSPASWAVSNGGQPLFVARSSGASPQPQPITVRPVVGRHPTVANSYMVYFGTGKYFEQGDNAVTGQVTQSFYGIWDRNLSGAGASTVLRSNLLQQQISSEVASGGGRARITTANTIDWATHRGWYMDLVNQQTGANGGERQNTEAILRDGTVIFSTLLPNPEICGVGGGSWMMVLKSADGARLDNSALDINGDGVINESDKVVPGSSTTGTTTTSCTTNTSTSTSGGGRRGGGRGGRTRTTTTTTTTLCTTTNTSTGATVGTSTTTNTCTTTTTNGVTSTPSCTTTSSTTGTSSGSGSGSGSGSSGTGTATVASGSYENSQMSAGQMLNNCNGATCIANNQTDGDPETNLMNLPAGPQGRITWQKLQ